MAKIIKNPIEVRLLFEKIDGEWTIELSARYGVGAEEYPDLEIRKTMTIVLTEPQQDAVIQMAAAVIYPQILENEEIGV